MLEKNFATRTGRVTHGFKYDHLVMYERGVEQLPPEAEFHKIAPNPQAVVNKVFGGNSQIDYALAQVVPLFDLFAEDPDVNIARVHHILARSASVISGKPHLRRRSSDLELPRQGLEGAA